MESTKSSPWFAASTIDPFDMGSCTLLIICQLLEPMACAASTVVGETLADPVGGDLDGNRCGVEHGRGDREELAGREEQQGGHEVDQRRHGLQQVEKWAEGSVHAVTATHPGADDDAEAP